MTKNGHARISEGLKLILKHFERKQKDFSFSLLLLFFFFSSLSLSLSHSFNIFLGQREPTSHSSELSPPIIALAPFCTYFRTFFYLFIYFLFSLKNILDWKVLGGGKKKSFSENFDSIQLGVGKRRLWDSFIRINLFLGVIRI